MNAGADLMKGFYRCYYEISTHVYVGVYLIRFFTRLNEGANLMKIPVNYHYATIYETSTHVYVGVYLIRFFTRLKEGANLMKTPVNCQYATIYETSGCLLDSLFHPPEGGC